MVTVLVLSASLASLGEEAQALLTAGRTARRVSVDALAFSCAAVALYLHFF